MLLDEEEEGGEGEVLLYSFSSPHSLDDFSNLITSTAKQLNRVLRSLPPAVSAQLVVSFFSGGIVFIIFHLFAVNIILLLEYTFCGCVNNENLLQPRAERQLFTDTLHQMTASKHLSEIKLVHCEILLDCKT